MEPRVPGIRGIVGWSATAVWSSLSSRHSPLSAQLLLFSLTSYSLTCINKVIKTCALLIQSVRSCPNNLQPPSPLRRSAAVLENTKKVRRTSQYPELVLYEDAAGHSLYVPPHQRRVLLTCPRTPSDNAFRHNSRTAAAVRRHCLLDTPPHSRQNPALRSTPQALRAPHPEHKAVKLASLGNGKPRNPSSSLASRPYRPKKRLMC